MSAHSLYFHIPFCQKRCSYCDFNTFAGISHLIPAYVSALTIEIQQYGALLNKKYPIKTIFFGGGTPSLLTARQFETIFSVIYDQFDVLQDAEISIEANPGTVQLSYLQDLRKLGINRLSFGVQTLQQHHFALMGRIHNFYDAIEAVKNARLAKFDNLNLDLIYGLPNQTLNEWKSTLDQILKFESEHISLYALGIEEGTPLFDWVEHGLVNEPDDDLAAAMYDFTFEKLTQSGYSLYEISNYAKSSSQTDFRCQHNLQYWRNLPYLGLGAGAHGYFNQHRTENIHGVPAYITRMQNNTDFSISSVILEITPINTYREMQETMMVGLRLINEGVNIQNFLKRFGQDPLTVFKSEISKLTNQGLITVSNNRIVLSQEGRLLGNLVFREFV
ncbi:MAG: coproporphyrinogen III oxidase [Anaerolineaceae bacterium]|nr:coproporphyrinogen III oxidase [Anaerolineaceae bacterium]